MRSHMSIAGFVLAALAGGSAAAEIGVLAAVNRDMSGARPSEQVRPIFIKEQLVENERIISTNGGGGQVLFLDQTSLTIAPNSEIVLDRYVYDPDSQSGDMTVTVLKGAMRFVGGRISKTSPATIKTPTATIGIRGGMGSISVQDGADTLYMHVAGFSSTITAGDQELTITREGGLASIGANGDLEYLGIAAEDFIANAFRPGAAGQGGGGATVSPAAANSGAGQVAAEVSADTDAVTQAAISTVGERQNTDFGALDVDITIEPTTEFQEATMAMAEDLGGGMTQEFDSFLAAGVYSTSVVSEGQTITDPNAFFQLVFSTTNNEGIAFFGIPETGDTLTFLEGDGVTGLGDQFLVQLGEENNFVAAAGLATTLLGDPTGSNFTLNSSAASTLSGNINVEYANSSLVQFLQSVSGDIANAPVIFIQDVAGQEGTSIAILQEDLDIGIEEFKALLQQLP